MSRIILAGLHEVEKRTAKLKRTGKSDKQNKIEEINGKACYFIRWRAMANAGRWYKYGLDVEKTIDSLVRGGTLAYQLEFDHEAKKDCQNLRECW
jgi:hypothetical protein